MSDPFDHLRLSVTNEEKRDVGEASEKKEGIHAQLAWKSRMSAESLHMAHIS